MKSVGLESPKMYPFLQHPCIEGSGNEPNTTLKGTAESCPLT